MKVKEFKGCKVLEGAKYYSQFGDHARIFFYGDDGGPLGDKSAFIIGWSSLKELPEQPTKADDVIERDNNNFNQKTDFNKQEKYKGDKGDFIDEYFEESTTEEFRGAMEFTIQKYWKRMGKKDDILLELYKIADYSMRFYEKEKLRRAIEIEKAKGGE